MWGRQGVNKGEHVVTRLEAGSLVTLPGHLHPSRLLVRLDGGGGVGVRAGGLWKGGREGGYSVVKSEGWGGKSETFVNSGQPGREGGKG